MNRLESNQDMPEQNENLEKLRDEYRLYEGCGNMLGIVPLSLAGYPEGTDYRDDQTLRTELKRFGNLIHSDSVMVLTGNPKAVKEQGYHFKMSVFEPSGSDESGFDGGVST